MSRNLIVAILVVAVIVFGYMIFSKTKSQNLPEITNNDLTNIAQDTNTTNGNIQTSQYVAYSEEAFQANADKRRILFFYASWCTTCRPADKDIQARVLELPEDVVVIRVNYNDSETDESERELARKYKITYQHTFVQIDSNTDVVKVWNGGSFDEIIKNLI